ncbi:hypothetical protein D5086_001460 [Populus alba]|uniref:Uncharacterized protein n=1 Tax=Populus alba TaxID=43335 RepID=A0ACC4D0B3_POPAL
MGRKAKKESFGFDAGNSNKSVSGRVNDGAAKPKKWSKNQNTLSEPQSSIMEFIWEELGPKFRDLLEMGKSGVIASLIVASQRLHTREHEWMLAPGTKNRVSNIITGNLQMVDMVLKLFALSSHLFCMGFEVLGGILLKLEPTFLNGFFLSTCEPLKVREVEALPGTEVEDGGASGRPSA